MKLTYADRELKLNRRDIAKVIDTGIAQRRLRSIMNTRKAKTAKVDVVKARANLKAWAREEVLKDGAINLRIDRAVHSVLLDLAARKKVPLSQMLRDWISERLEIEACDDPAQATVSFQVAQVLRNLADDISAHAAKTTWEKPSKSASGKKAKKSPAKKSAAG